MNKRSANLTGMSMNRRSYKGSGNPFYGKHHSQETKDKISQAKKGKSIIMPLGCHAGERNSMFGKTHSQETKERWSQLRKGRNWQTNLIEGHHIDLDKKHNEPTNKIRLSKSDHQRLHRRAYDYLVEQGMINDYIAWFIVKYHPMLYGREL